MKGAKYVVVDVDEQPEEFGEIINNTGAVIVPQVLIGEQVVVGLSYPKMAAALAQ